MCVGGGYQVLLSSIHWNAKKEQGPSEEALVKQAMDTVEYLKSDAGSDDLWNMRKWEQQQPVVIIAGDFNTRAFTGPKSMADPSDPDFSSISWTKGPDAVVAALLKKGREIAPTPISEWWCPPVEDAKGTYKYDTGSGAWAAGKGGWLDYAVVGTKHASVGFAPAVLAESAWGSDHKAYAQLINVGMA